MSSIRLLVLGAIGLVLAMTASCGFGLSEPTTPSPSPSPSPSVTFGFTQLIPQEGTEHGLLRVVNEGSDPQSIIGLGLDWPPYGASFTQSRDTPVPLASGQTIDLKLDLPPARCDRASERAGAELAPLGILHTTTGDVTRELTASGATYLRRLLARQCDEAAVADTVDVGFTDWWVQQGHGHDSRASGQVRVSRISGNDTVRLLGIDGSVLYDVALRGPALLTPGARQLTVPVDLLPGNRCDEHARGQATAPFDFELRMRIGGRTRVIAFAPPVSGQEAATLMLDRACE